MAFVDDKSCLQASNRKNAIAKHTLDTKKLWQESDLAISGWESDEQTWNEQICKKWIKWGHILRHWNITGEEYFSDYRIPLKLCNNDEYRTKLIEAYGKFYYQKDLNEQTLIPYWLAAMVYAKLFLNRDINWELSDGKHKANKTIQNSKGPFVIRNSLSTINFNHDKGSQKRPLNSSNNEDNEPLSKLICPNEKRKKRQKSDEVVSTLQNLPCQLRDSSNVVLDKARSRSTSTESTSTIPISKHDLLDNITIQTHPNVLKIQNLQKELEIMQNEYKNKFDDNNVQINIKNQENTSLQVQISKIQEDLQQQQKENKILQNLLSKQKEDLQKEKTAKEEFIKNLEVLKEKDEKISNFQDQISRLIEDLRKNEENRKIVLNQRMEELKNKNGQILNLQNQNLRLKEDMRKNENGAIGIINQLKNKSEENFGLQIQISKLNEILNKNHEIANVMHHRNMEGLKKKKDEEIVVLCSQISNLEKTLYKQDFEKKRIYEEIKNLKKTNEENVIIQFQIPKLKEDLQKEKFEKTVLSKKIEDLTTQNTKIQNDCHQFITKIQTLNNQIENIKNISQLENQTLIKEIDKIKNEKRLIVQLDECQFEKIVGLISQKVSSNDEVEQS